MITRPGRSPWASLRRAVRYHLLLPLRRSRQPPAHIARGVAVGVFWGVLPIFGTQMLAIMATWKLARGTRWDLSLVQALAWQWVNNPLTMLPMYFLFYTTGHLLAGHGWTGGYDAFIELWHHRAAATATWTDQVVRIATVLALPTLAGSIPWALIAAAAGYHWGLRMATARSRAEG